MTSARKTYVCLTKEHLDSENRLVVPVRYRFDSTPKRDGWKPFWVNVNLNRIPVRYVTYKRVTGSN
jgi:hypothetical protein